MSISFPTDLDTLTNPTSSDTLDSPSHSGQHADVNDAIEALEAKVGVDSSAVTSSHDYKIGALELLATADGWIGANETWTYASATTFTISGDVTDKYQINDKIKLTQTTDKYFRIVAISYSSPNTTFTVNGGGIFTLADASITSPFYSKIENPQGFALKKVHIGSFDSGTTTGNKSISGIGFKPSRVEFHALYGSSAVVSIMKGYSDGTNEFVQTTAIRDSISATYSSVSTSQCIEWAAAKSGGVTTEVEGTISSFDTNGFTVNLTTANSSRPIGYIAYL
jgi:hypothetical protein